MNDAPMHIGGNAREMLKGYIDRIERLEDEKAGISDDIKAVYADAKSNGFDPKVMRKIISESKQDKNKRAEFEAVLDVYRNALGRLIDTPLGEAAVAEAIKRAGTGKRKSADE